MDDKETSSNDGQLLDDDATESKKVKTHDKSKKTAAKHPKRSKSDHSGKGDAPADESGVEGAAPDDYLWSGDERRTPSQEDILKRLLEKNEIVVKLTKKNVELEGKVKELTERRLRGAAEFENYRKRTRKERDLLKNQTKVEILGPVLEVVDDFERAFSAAGDRNDDFMQGIRLIYNNLVSVLEGFGLKKMDALGEEFDPGLHMAVASIEKEDAKPHHIVEVIQEGYLMGDTVVRAAKVVIAK